MSVARFALRHAAVQALRGATLVGENVKDSAIGAIDIAADGTLRSINDLPFIAVYTDEGTVTDAPLRDLRQNGSVDFVLEIGVTSAMMVRNPDTGESESAAGIPTTDAGFEAMLDIIERQATIALTDPGNAWAEIWRKLHDNVTRIERRRAATAEGGTRLAARQTRMALTVKPDPVPGQPLGPAGVWTLFRDRLAADASEDSDLVAVLDALIGEPGEMTLERLRAMRGNTDDEARALRINYPRFEPGTLIRRAELEREF